MSDETPPQEEAPLYPKLPAGMQKHVWQPGKSGNPKGGSARQRARAELNRYWKKNGFNVEFVEALQAMATGKRKTYVDEDGKKRRTYPNLEAMKFLVDRMDGPLAKEINASVTGDTTGVQSIRDFLNAPEPDDETQEG